MRSRNRRLAVAGAALIAGLAVWATRPDGAVADRCAGADGRLAGIWDDGVRERTRAAFMATGLPYATDAYRSFADELDGYARDWVETYSDSCRKTYVDDVQDEATHTLRLTCLQQRLTQLRTTAEVFTTADDDAVDRAATAAAELPPIADCSDVASLEKGIQPPGDPSTRARVDAIRASIDEARALTDARRTEDAIEVASRALDQANATGYRPVIAEATYQLAMSRSIAAEIAAATAGLEEASLLAEELGYDRLRARALVSLTSLIARTSSNQSEIQSWERRARAALGRLDDSGELRGDLARALASAEVTIDLDRSLELLDEARVAYERIIDDPRRGAERSRARLDLSETLAIRAHQLVDALRPGDAVRAARRALAIAEDSYGAEHPVTIRRVETLGHALRADGKLDRAAAQFARSRRFYQTERGRQILAQAPSGPKEPGADRTRPVTGRVVDPAGRPVAGARVAVGAKLIGDGSRGVAGWGGMVEHHLHLRIATTGEDGRFTIPDAAGSELRAAAESPVGRSWPVAIDRGDDPVDVELELRPLGSLRGRLADSGERAGAIVQLLHRPPDTPPRSAIVGHVAADGSFAIPRLAAGEYDLFFGTVTERIGTPAALESVPVTIRPGETTEVELELPGGLISLEVAITGRLGAEIASAQVVAFEGDVRAERSREINERVVAGAAVRSSFVTADGRPARFDRMKPGRHTFCVIPFARDVRNPEFRRAIAEDIDFIEVHCFPVDIAGDETVQRRTFEVPPMRVVRD